MPTDLLDSYLVFPVFRAEASEQSCFVALPWDLLNASVQGPQCHYQATQEKHSKLWAKCGFALQRAPSNTFHGLSQMESLFLCVFLHCPECRAMDVCQLSISNTAPAVSSLYLCVCTPLRAAEPFPWRGWALVLPCIVWAAPSCAGCSAYGTAFSMEFLLDTGTLCDFSPAFPHLSDQPPAWPFVQKLLPWTSARFLTKKDQFKGMFIRV